MRLICLLSWFDERPDWLAELVASVARAGADHVIAVDGAYALYPQARGSSGSTQAAVVAAAALGAGIGVTVHVPEQPWVGNEVEKRTVMFRLGHAIAESGRDWLWVCDADEVITRGAGVRDELTCTDLDVGEVLLVENGGHLPIRKLFRAQPGGIRVEERHCRYLTGVDTVLWDAARPSQQVDAESLWDVRVLHRPADRDALRDQGRNSYYEVRRMAGVEG